MTIEVFTTVGSQSWVVPPGITYVKVKCLGAQGGNYQARPGGQGGTAVGTIATTPGETLTIAVGVSGMGSGSGGTPTGGGGSSFVARGSELLICAGGGGGSGGYGGGPSGGGAGGGLSGNSGATAPYNGKGATQSSNGPDGTAGTGGIGGGGFGYFRGGSGVGGGGGGSGYIGGATDATTTTGGNTGNGEITLTYGVEFVGSVTASGWWDAAPAAALSGVGADDIQFALLNQADVNTVRVVDGWTLIGTITVASPATRATVYWRHGPGNFQATNPGGTVGVWMVGIVAYSGLKLSGNPYQGAAFAASQTAPSVPISQESFATRFYAASSGSTTNSPSITPPSTARMGTYANGLAIGVSDDPVTPPSAPSRIWASGTGMTASMAATVVLASASTSAALGNVIVGGAKKAVSAMSVIVGGVKKPVTSVSVIVGGVKKSLA